MTEKRFELNNIVKKGTVSFWDNDKQVIINASGILDLLNNFNDENERLKKENELKGDFRGFITKDIQKIKDENEQLKKEIKRLKYHLNETEEELQEYKDFMSLG